MKTILIPLIAVLFLLSCKNEKVQSVSNNSIASLTYEAELKYINNRIWIFSRLSDTGRYYFNQNSILDNKIDSLKQKINSNQSISLEEQDDLLQYFENTLNHSPYIDFKKFKELENTPVSTSSDLDLLSLYIKNCFVAILNDNKLLPFDTWGTMAAAEKWNIKSGEKFSVEFNSTAINSLMPIEWYIVKDSTDLTKDNILDTLHPDVLGNALFETKNYHKGENKIQVVARLKKADGDQIVTRIVRFTVK